MAEPRGPIIDLTGELPAVVRLSAEDLDDVVEELAAYHARFAPLFRRREQRKSAEVYLRGLLTAEVPRKNVEAMVLRLLGTGAGADRQVRALQQFISEGAWDDEAILAEHQRLVDATLGEEDGVFIIDGSEVPKQGRHSVGVARQWCGATGKKDNCQAGVFLGYASRRGYTLLDRRLYLPEGWFAEDHRALWQACRIPNGTEFRTKHDLAGELVEQVVKAGRVRGRWVVCDEGYGDSPALLDRLGATGLWYLAEVPRDTMVWPLVEPDGATPRARPQAWVPAPKPSHKGPVPRRARAHPESPAKVRLDEWAEQVSAANWQRYRILEGSKGPLVADFVAFRAVTVRDKVPGPEVWVLFRRKVGGSEDEPTLKVYLSNAPAETPLEMLIRVCGLRWPIESCFEESKGELGLDQYEVRSWPGWHHHLTLVLLAHHFLVRLQRRLSERGGAPKATSKASGRHSLSSIRRSGRAAGRNDDRSRPATHDRGQTEPERSPHAAERPAAATDLRPTSRAGAPGLPPASQGGRLSLTSQAAAAALG